MKSAIVLASLCGVVLAAGPLPVGGTTYDDQDSSPAQRRPRIAPGVYFARWGSGNRLQRSRLTLVR